jgi:hypothetical protein
MGRHSTKQGNSWDSHHFVEFAAPKVRHLPHFPFRMLVFNWSFAMKWIANLVMQRPMWSVWRMGLLALVCGVALWGCDVQHIRELEEGVSTEADVRLRFGEPEHIWPEADGARTFEYNRQPAGHRNYMITIGTDGKMAALRQVLTPHNFARIQPGMPMPDVRRLLGKPMQTVPFPQQQETHADWRYLDGPNTSDSKIFTVVYGADAKVIRTFSVRDPSLDKG